jgi:branched-chain amino acid transport system permease protein
VTLSDQILQFIISGISTGSIYALVGLGFMIIYSVTRVVNFAQGEFVMLGGMFTASFCSYGFSLGVSVLLATILTTLVGLLFYQMCIYPIRPSLSFSSPLVFPSS